MDLKLPLRAQKIIATLKKAGFEAYAVGGSVRDLLLGRETHGWDFTTNATPEEILRLFPDSFYDNQFGTVGVKIKAKSNKLKAISEETVDIYEITTYRSEHGYTNHRHPDKIIWGKTLEEDLARRDFTINAIAFDGKKIVDPFAGQADLKHQIIMAVGEPQERFAEDALRLMRALRLAAELGFMIDETTLAAIKSHAFLITQISSERVRDELFRLLAAPYAADGILLMRSTGLLKHIFPELDTAFATPQKSPQRHHIFDVGTHSVMSLKHCPSPDPLVRLATLLHDIGKPKTMKYADGGVITFYNHEVVGTKIVREIADRLRLSRRQKDRLVALVRWHQFSVDERQTDSALRRFIRRVGRENLEDILALRIGDRLGGGARETSWRLELFKKRLEEVQKQPFTVADLKVDGYDVMTEFNLKPGPVVGKILNQLFTEVEAGTLPNERKVLLSRMRELAPLSLPQN
ncbi:MAG: CCA tRNA nucleotidyltransferase [Patescibacteria group bacterium]